MKFSYSLIKKFLPKINKNKLLEALNLYLFEAEFIDKNTLDISISANRYSDCSGHFGIIKELSFILGLKNHLPKIDLENIRFVNKNKPHFKIRIENGLDCYCYCGQYYNNVKVKSSPPWLKKILIENGLRPINNLVDLMNYVMLETGQPLHVFDADKLEGQTIIVRRAYKGEKFKSIDEVDYILDKDVLVISDLKKAQAIAGIKGGYDSQVDKNTKNILIEAATFNSFLIYKTSKKINLKTDASLRFSHGLSDLLPVYALKRVESLMQEFYGLKPSWTFWSNQNKKIFKKFFKVNLEKFKKFSGLEIEKKELEDILKKLEFKKIKENLFQAPILRNDLENIEDIYEEIIRIYGLNKIKLQRPKIELLTHKQDDLINLKDKITDLMVKFGFTEVYNYSFSKNGEIEILNPISSDKKFLRDNLFFGLIKNIHDNLRFFDEISIFEIGKIFYKKNKEIFERYELAVGLFSKKEETFFKLKGVLYELLKALNVQNFDLRILNNHQILLKGFEILVDNEIVGFIGKNFDGFNLFNLNLEKLLNYLQEEFDFKPIPKYPGVTRDISILVNKNFSIGLIISDIQNVNLDIIFDVDLIDEYIDKSWQNEQSLTFRIIFQKEDRTLTSEEVDNVFKKIEEMLVKKYNAKIR